MSEIGLAKAELDTPILWVELDRLERNITTLAAHFRKAGVNWRPHTKGIKTPAIAHKLLAAGAMGVTCAKLGEAEVMAAAGIRDILVANQIVGPHKVTRLVNLCAQVDVKVAVDHIDNVQAIGRAATTKGVTAGLVIELNTGMNRAGVQPGAETVNLARQITATPGVRLAGLMSWEGHTLEHQDPETKRKGIETAISALTTTAQQCRDEGMAVEIVSAGGSGTYQITPFLPGITEIQAGGAIYCDMTYQGWGVALEPALFVRSMVTSRPTGQRIICDAGFKTLPRGFASPQPVAIEHIDKVVFSAEHGIITLTAPSATPKVGDGIDIVVGYSDATVCLHDQIYGIRNDRVEAVWPVLGRGKLR